jgi:HAD superfamily hydrolase (TIGR01509 family)
MSGGRAVETVFLDAGGVLVGPDWERVAAVLERHGLRTTESALAAADPPAKREMDVPPTIRSTDDKGRGGIFLRAVLRRAGIAPDAGRLEAAVASLLAEDAARSLWSRVLPGVPEALARLRAAGLKRVVVSNSDGRLEALFRGAGLRDRVDHLLDSGLLGYEKPDPRIFREALRVSGARPDVTVHVGDFYEIDVVGARAAGLRAVLLDPAGLHADRDCERSPSLAAFAEALTS